MGKPVKKKDKPQADDKQTKISLFFGNIADKKESKLFTKCGTTLSSNAGKQAVVKQKQLEVKSTVKCTLKSSAVNHIPDHSSRKGQTMVNKNTSYIDDDDDDIIIIDDSEQIQETENVNSTELSAVIPNCVKFSVNEVKAKCDDRLTSINKEQLLNLLSSKENLQNFNNKDDDSKVASEMHTPKFNSNRLQTKNCGASELCDEAEPPFVTPKKQSVQPGCSSVESSPDIICDTPNADNVLQDAAARRRKSLSSRSFLCPKNLLTIQPGLKPAHLRTNLRKRASNLIGNVSVIFNSHSESLSEEKISEESVTGDISATTAHARKNTVSDNDFKASHDNSIDACSKTKGESARKNYQAGKELMNDHKADYVELLENESFCIQETQHFDTEINVDMMVNFEFTDNMEENIDEDSNLSNNETSHQRELIVQNVDSWEKAAVNSNINNIFVKKSACAPVKLGLNEKSSSKLINALEEVESRAEMAEESMWLKQRLIKQCLKDDFNVHSQLNAEQPLQNPGTTNVKVNGKSKCSIKRQAKSGLSPSSKRQATKGFTELKDIGHTDIGFKDKELEKLASSINKAKKVLRLENHTLSTSEAQQNCLKQKQEPHSYKLDVKKNNVNEKNNKKVTLESDELLCELLSRLESPSKANSKSTAHVLKELNPTSGTAASSLELGKGTVSNPNKENCTFVWNKTSHTNKSTKNVVRQSDIDMLDELFGQDVLDGDDKSPTDMEINCNNEDSLGKYEKTCMSNNKDMSNQRQNVIVLDDSLNMFVDNSDCILIDTPSTCLDTTRCSSTKSESYTKLRTEDCLEHSLADSVIKETCDMEIQHENISFVNSGKTPSHRLLENVNNNYVATHSKTDKSSYNSIHADVEGTTDTNCELPSCEKQFSVQPKEYSKVKESTILNFREDAEDPSRNHTILSNYFTDKSNLLKHKHGEIMPGPSCKSNDSKSHDSSNVNHKQLDTDQLNCFNSAVSEVNGCQTSCCESSIADSEVNHSKDNQNDSEINVPTSIAGPKEDTELSVSMYDMLCESFNDEFQDIVSTKTENKDFRFTDLWSRFTVQEVTLKRDETHLILLCNKSRKSYQCILRGNWTYTVIVKEDVVNIIGDVHDDVYIIDDRDGLIVVNPDKLLSGTSVVNSTFCARKSVFNEKFKGIDSGNIQMFYGSVIHSLFQLVLKDCVRNESAIMKVAALLLKTSKFLHEMYSHDIPEANVIEEIREYCPSLSSWLAKHTEISGKESKSKLTSDMIVTEIHDIEENIWSPRFGLKGKIDVTVKAKLRKPNRSEELKIVPLELKTGKASFSHEHKGQVTLYSMMSSDRRENSDEGILLYLKHGQMESVPVKPQNKRDLIQLRNQLAYNLTQEVCREVAENGNLTYHLGQLPKPINNQRACSKCAQLLNCSIYQRQVEHTVHQENHAMSTLVPETLQHLTDSDLTYFTHWMLCLDMEEQESQKMHLSQIWCSSSSEREKSGDCISNLMIASSDLDIPESQCFSEGRGCSITFTRDNGYQGSALTDVGLVVNDMVVISSEDGQYIALATGFVRRILPNLVEVVVDRDYLHETRNYSKMRFRLDRNDSFSTSGYLYANLTRLMEPTPRATSLRQLIIGLKQPEFDLKLSKACIQKVKTIFKPLNKPQRTAILKVLMSKDYVLIKGFPGTGKTAAIVALVKILQLIGKSVLLTSYTHSAVDNILLKLKKDGVRFLRLGRRGRIHPSILPHSAEVLTTSTAINSVHELKLFYDSYDVIATSALGVNHPVFNQRKFDVCIVDEASQVLQPACLGPLFHCQKFVLVGDPKQLPPVVQSKETRKLGMAESLFVRLENTGATYDLDLQYRMNRKIMELSNSLVYDGKLQCGNQAVAEQICSLNHSLLMNAPSWIKKVLSNDIEKSIVFLDTQGVFSIEVSNGKGLTNETEANLVVTLLKSIVKADVAAHDVGVISPYRSQVKLIKQKLSGCSNVMDTEVNTVDQYQGRDKSIIIVSFVRTHSDNTGELLKDLRRLNVAMTRARHKLVFIGNAKTLTAYEHVANILKHLEATNNIIQVQEP